MHGLVDFGIKSVDFDLEMDPMCFRKSFRWNELTLEKRKESISWLECLTTLVFNLFEIIFPKYMKQITFICQCTLGVGTDWGCKV